MKLGVGIVGLPNVGKSTLFNILTKQSVTSANYPFATIDPNVGVVPVPDERLDKLSAMSASKETIPAVVEFFDIAGLVRNANKGEGLGNQFLTHIRHTDAILHLVRCFKSDEIIHVEGAPDPIRDIEIIELELIYKDLETITKQVDKYEGESRTGDKDARKALAIFQALQADLENGTLARRSSTQEDPKAQELLKPLNLLSIKPQFFVLNGAEDEVSDELRALLAERNAAYVISNLADKEIVPRIITTAYESLNLISFFTTGEKESRAWTTEKGSKAPQAAGVIHTDFEKKFIRAEVINWETLLEAGSWAKAREKGVLRLEGKEYVVQDGDVMVFRVGG